MYHFSLHHYISRSGAKIQGQVILEKTLSNTGRRRVNEAGQGKQLFKCLHPKPRETTEAHTDKKLFKG